MSKLSFIIDANSPSRTILFNWDGLFLRYGDDTDGKIECNCDGKHIRIGGDIEKEPMYSWDGKFLRYAEGAGQQYQKEGTYMKLYEYDGQHVKDPKGSYEDQDGVYLYEELLYRYHDYCLTQAGDETKPLYEVTDHIPIEILLYIVKTFFNENDSKAKVAIDRHFHKTAISLWSQNNNINLVMNFKILIFNNSYYKGHPDLLELYNNLEPSVDVCFNLGKFSEKPGSHISFYQHIDYYLSVVYDKVLMRDVLSFFLDHRIEEHLSNELDNASFSFKLVMSNWDGVIRHKLFNQSGRSFFVGNEYCFYNYSHFVENNSVYRQVSENTNFLSSITTTWSSLYPSTLDVDIRTDKVPFFKFWDIKKYALYLTLITSFLTVTISESIYERKPNEIFSVILEYVALIGLFSINSNRKYLSYISSTVSSLFFLYGFFVEKDYEWLLGALIVFSSGWLFDDNYLRYSERISKNGRIWENVVLAGIVFIILLRFYLYS